jgi:hypothetical protein
MISATFSIKPINTPIHLGHVLFILWLQEEPNQLRALKNLLSKCESLQDFATYKLVIDTTAYNSLVELYDSFPKIVSIAENANPQELRDLLRNNTIN